MHPSPVEEGQRLARHVRLFLSRCATASIICGGYMWCLYGKPEWRDDQAPRAGVGGVSDGGTICGILPPRSLTSAVSPRPRWAGERAHSRGISCRRVTSSHVEFKRTTPHWVVCNEIGDRPWSKMGTDTHLSSAPVRQGDDDAGHQEQPAPLEDDIRLITTAD